jgi:hypothetical protein
MKHSLRFETHFLVCVRATPRICIEVESEAHAFVTCELFGRKQYVSCYGSIKRAQNSNFVGGHVGNIARLDPVVVKTRLLSLPWVDGSRSDCTKQHHQKKLSELVGE